MANEFEERETERFTRPDDQTQTYGVSFPGSSELEAKETRDLRPDVRPDSDRGISLPESGPSRLPPDLDAPPEVKRLLGEGGLGRVLAARDPVLRRRLAMKVLKPGVSEYHLERFITEAQVTAQLDHPGVAPVYRFGEVDGAYYYTMKQIEGQSLRGVLDSRREGGSNWTVPRLVDALIDAGNALAYAHDRGVIHRDVKPANIMLGSYGEVTVVDWGLAKVMGAARARLSETAVQTLPQSSMNLTKEGKLLGTPAYMPPEQATGDLEAIGPHSDVYALGGTLFAILTGRPPFWASNMGSLVKKILNEPPTRPSVLLSSEVDPELEAICLKALAKAPEDRYPDAAAMVEDLRRWREGRVVHATEGGIWTHARKWVGRNWKLVTVAGLLLMLLIGSGATAFFVSDARNRARRKEALRSYSTGMTAYGRKEWEAAEEALGKAIELDRMNPLFPYFRGVVRGKLGKHEAAIADYTKAVSLDDTFAGAYFNRGTAHESTGDHEAALDDYTKAIGLRPDRAGYLVGRARAWRELGELGKAGEDLKKALEQAPRLAEAWLELGRLHEEQDRPTAALEAYDHVLSIEPGAREARLRRVQLLKERDDVELALAECEAVLRRAPNDSEALLQKATLLIRGRQPAEALGVVQRVLDNPTIDRTREAHAYYVRGLARHHLRQPEAALQDLNRARERLPDYPPLWATRGAALHALGRLDEALENYDTALDRFPEHAETWFNRACLHYQRGDLKKALSDYDRAIELNPNRAEYYYHRGDTRRQVGHRQRAHEDLTRFLELAPDDPRAGAVKRVLKELGKVR